MQLSHLFYTATDDDSDSSVAIEKYQAIDEGRDWSAVADEYEEMRQSLRHQPETHQDAAHRFFDGIQDLPIRDDYPYVEPNDLDEIRSQRPAGPRQLSVADVDIADRLHGGWLGRCAGCLLGKPIEGWNSKRIWGFLKETDQFPLREYITAAVDDSHLERHSVDPNRTFIENVDAMPRDDDIDYTLTGLSLLQADGETFTTEDVANFWLNNLPIRHTFTAERVTYRNLINNVEPPETATVANPYREAIGAQIRADCFGYVSIGNPEQAASFAWRDGRLSHVKNGIYGEMWVAAMIAAAPACSDVSEVIEVGLSEIPKSSRLAAAIESVIDWRESGLSYEEVVRRVHEEWNDECFYDWLHVIPNAQIVAIGLLWGDGSFEQSICRAVQCCFDTDCNGATVGSILGVMHGTDWLPESWTTPLNDTIHSSLNERPRSQISELVAETLEVYQSIS